MDDQELMERARRASQHSYSPYSHFQVGAAVITRDGQVFTGCNVENASYGLSICAERVAISKAVCKGKTSGDFVKIAVAGKLHEGDWQPCSPCGACRQFIYEVAHNEKVFQVVYLNERGQIASVPIGDLLPEGFRFSR